jgi:hypothetical protein
MVVTLPAIGELPLAVDLILYFFVFAAASRAAFSRSFPGREGRVLAVAVGLILAFSLALAQERIGFSLNSLGPAAMIVLFLIIFIASFKLLRHSQIPLALILLLPALLCFILIHAIMPELTKKVMEAFPVGLTAALAVVIAIAVMGVESKAGGVRKQRPGSQLVHEKIVPSEDDLRNEAKLVKKRIRRPIRNNGKDEKRINKETEQVQEDLQREKADPEIKSSETELLDHILKRAHSVRERSQKLSRLDQALQQLDLKWIRAAHNIDISTLTPTQQMVVRKTFRDERKHYRVEEHLDPKPA